MGSVYVFVRALVGCCGGLALGVDMNDLSVHDLMGEDHELTVKLHTDTKHIEITIHDDRCVEVYDDITHINAWESLVYFAKQVINLDRRIQEDIAIIETEDKYHRGFKQ